MTQDMFAKVAAMQHHSLSNKVFAPQRVSVDRDARRESLRASMPEVAAMVDLFRLTFGEIRVLYAEESGRVVGDYRRRYAK